MSTSRRRCVAGRAPHSAPTDAGLLTLLADPDAAYYGPRLLTHLAWNPSIDPAQLVGNGLPMNAVRSGLGWLAASGRVGYDLSERSYYHRDLPIDITRVLRRNPRLASAQRLVERGSVTPDGTRWRVAGDHDTYYVEEDRCTCRWQTETHGTRGPCSHLLAVATQQAVERAPRPRDQDGGQ